MFSVVDKLLRNLRPASQSIPRKADFGHNMVEDTQSELKALPHDIVQVSIEKYLEDSDNNFKVIDVRTTDEYCENR